LIVIGTNKSGKTNFIKELTAGSGWKSEKKFPVKDKWGKALLDVDNYLLTLPAVWKWRTGLWRDGGRDWREGGMEG
jgi:hypothetical protein